MNKRGACVILYAGILFWLVAGALGKISPNVKLLKAEAAVAQYYVDSVDEGKLVEDAIRGMLTELDPHSQYSTPEEAKELNEPLVGNFSGIGISYNMSSDTLYVLQTIAGGPSERVGILAGDRLIEVNDSSIAGMKMKNTEIARRLRGPKGSTVKIKGLRYDNGKADTINFVITRADIPIYSVDAAYMVDDKTGYLRVNKFAAETHKEVVEAIKKLKKSGMTSLILDLTDNGGGYLSSATDLLGELLEPGKVTVYTEGRKSPRHDFISTPSEGEALFKDGRLVVMVNQYSASASEITSGAVQDWDRGVIVGRRTYGKGLVQRPIPFPDGSMIRLTVAHYYTPTGRDIQKPYRQGRQKEYAKDILDRFNHGELMHEDSIKFIDSLRVNTLRTGRPIYGGGGITPDVFVPLDTTENTKYFRDVQAKGLFNRFAIGYVDAHRKELKKKYKSDDEFVKDFMVTDEMISHLREMAVKEGIEPNEEQEARSLPLIKMIIKGLIGRDVFDNVTYFKVANQHSSIFREAMRVINSDDYDKILTEGRK
ncbi:MAG: S41 family peptidase [Bacteroidales bacterium]|nr:S41 family peptidase [Bacteroidales bacterium]